MSGFLVALTFLLVSGYTSAQSAYCLFGAKQGVTVPVGDGEVYCTGNTNYAGNPARCTGEGLIYRCRGIRLARAEGNFTVNRYGTDLSNLCTSLVNSNSDLYGGPVFKVVQSVVLGFRGDYELLSGVWVAPVTGTATITDIDCYVPKTIPE